MIEPIKAPVRPRVIVEDGVEPVLLEDLVATIVDDRDVSAIWLSSPSAAGTTTALRHIAHLFAEIESLRFTDDHSNVSSIDRKSVGIIVFRGSASTAKLRFVKCKLAGWGRDEWIEYLLATHRSECASVMRRLQNDPDIRSLSGNASVLRLILDEMAANDQISSVKAALSHIVDAHFPNLSQRQQVARESLVSMLGVDYLHEESDQIAVRNLTSEQQHLRWIPAVRIQLAAEAAFAELESTRFHFRKVWPRELLAAVAPQVAASPTVQNTLWQWLLPLFRNRQPLAASLLHAANCLRDWPIVGRVLLGFIRLNLKGAILDGANFSHIPIARGSLQSASLKHAQFVETDLRGTNGTDANFDGACLHQARMSRFKGERSSFIGASLTEARGRRVNFFGANFRNADLTRSQFKKCDFKVANLVDAKFDRAVLSYSCFRLATLDGASFQHANLDSTDFLKQDLTVADFRNASFRSARLKQCNLEEMELSNADFRDADLDGALLTCSVMPRANFVDASLRGARLAHIEWESADLRNADLTGATFHLGSSRSGLVGSSIPMLGSRTGFYTDESREQEFKSPEEIRKANLRGADIRGAIITHVDFYLVDLRDALYDAEQEEQLQRTGAILAYEPA